MEESGPRVSKASKMLMYTHMSISITYKEYRAPRAYLKNLNVYHSSALLATRLNSSWGV